MQPTNVFWTDPKELYPQTFLPTDPSARQRDFWVHVRWPEPVSTPFYFGENAAPDRRVMDFNALPEMYSIDDKVPEGYDVKNYSNKVERAKFIYKV